MSKLKAKYARCGCNDYSKLTASTGIVSINTGNSALTGIGAQTVITASGNGTIIKSVRIKAYGPVTTGMVRLFVGTVSHLSLYKEVPIPTTPSLTATPTPTPVLPTFEMELNGGLKLNTGMVLSATTQNSENFNVIAEGLNWAYPSPLPSVCCNFKQETAITGAENISAANTSLNGTGTIAQIFQAPTSGTPSYGTTVTVLTLKALQSTNEGMVRIFISPDGSTWTLMKEIYIPETTQSSFEPSFKQVVNLNFDLCAGYYLGASTQLAQSFALVSCQLYFDV